MNQRDKIKEASSEFITQKKELEDKLWKLLDEFEENTGFNIQSVNMNRSQRILATKTSASKLLYVDVTVDNIFN